MNEGDMNDDAYELPTAVGDDGPPSKHFTQLVLDYLSKDEKRTIENCAKLAMKDHVTQDSQHMALHHLQFLKVEKAFKTTNGSTGTKYAIAFLAKSDKYGEAFLEANLWVDIVKLKVLHVRLVLPSKGEWYTGRFCIPKGENSPPCLRPIKISLSTNRRRSLRLMQSSEMDVGQTMTKDGAEKKKASADQANKKSKKIAEALGDRPPIDELSEDQRKINEESAKLEMNDNAAQDAVGYNEECAKLEMKDNAAQDDVGYTPLSEEERKIINGSSKLARKDNAAAQDAVGDRPYISPSEKLIKKNRMLAKAAKNKCNVRLVLDDLTKAEKKVIDECTKLAMADHAVQDKHNLRFDKVVDTHKTITGTIMYLVAFQAQSDKYGLATFQANVYVSCSMRQVWNVRLIKPTKGKWYTGMFCVPAI